MIYNKSVVRKLILLEIKNRLIFEQAAQSATPAVTFSTEEDKQNMLQGMDKLINALKGEVQTISESEASKYEQRLYKATKEGFGFGTDEEEIEKVLTEIPTIVDVSYVSAKFEKTHQGAWTFTPTLESVFSSELDDTDMERHVNTVINDKMKTSFIKLGEFGVLGRDQFFDLIKSGKEFQDAGLKDPSSVFKGKAKSGGVAASGVLSALDALNDDDPSTEFYIAPAVDQLAVPAAAGAAADVGGSINPVTATKELGSKVGGVAKTAGEEYRKAADAAGEAAKKAAGEAAKNVGEDAAEAAAKKAAKKASLKAGAKAAGMTLLKSIPQVGLKAIPVLGWALLAAELADWAMSGNIQEDTALALDSKLYLKIKDMFRQVLPGLEASRAAMAGTPVLEASEEAGADESKSTSLGWGLEQPYVLNIIKTMNAYASKKSLEGYTPPPEENKWSPVVQEAWLKFAPHALANCGLYSQFKISNVDNWKNMSAAMKSKYPGYTPNPRGCLAFCLDAYYCELRYGNEAPSSSSGRGGRGGGGGGGSGEDDTKRGKETKGSSKKITVKLNQTGKNFKSSGFSLSDNRDPDELMIKAILNEMSAQSVRAGYPGGQVTFFFVLDKNNKIVDVQNELGGGQNAGLNLPLKNIRNALEDIAKGLIFPTGTGVSYSKDDEIFDNPKRFRKKAIKVTFNIPAGNVKDLRP